MYFLASRNDTEALFLARCLMGWMEAVLQWKSFSSIEIYLPSKTKETDNGLAVLSNVAVFNPCLGRLPPVSRSDGLGMVDGMKE